VKPARGLKVATAEVDLEEDRTGAHATTVLRCREEARFAADPRRRTVTLTASPT
jgi:hypothetical protein